ncbi:MAG: antirestriction protein ArdA [Bacteroidota bacterium]
MTNVQIYVGTYAKYNSGSLYGKWFKLRDYSNYQELLEAIRELHKDEQDPEFMFQDYECPTIFDHLGLLSECHISENIYEVLKQINNCVYSFEVLEAYCDSIGCYENIEELIDKVSDSYQGEFSGDIEFTQELLEATGELSIDLPSYIHIDWERTANDIMMDYASSNNHYFRLM